MPFLGKREIPELGAAPEPAEQYVTRTYKLRLVTPMFGGGAEAGKIDPERPIRASSIRGHLRWWWRLLHQKSYVENGVLDAAAMRSREFEIWGSTDSPSPVQIKVKTISALQKRFKGDPNDRPFKPFQFGRFDPESYALFSAIENKDLGQDAAIVKEGFEFELSLHWPTDARLKELRQIENSVRKRKQEPELADSILDITSDIERTISAWIAWGGIGARTRRGLGSLDVLAASKPLPDAAVPDGCDVYYGQSTTEGSMKAWANAVEVYQLFRQSFRGRKRRKPRIGAPVPGRSHWPEPDSIRKITGCQLTPSASQPALGCPADEDFQDHSTPVVSQTIPHFPRAVLGLPIGFHFADGPGKRKPAVPSQDPAGVELKPRARDMSGTELVDDQGRPSSGDRMASPIITKAVKLKNAWRSAVLVLPHQLALKMSCVLEGENALWVPAPHAARPNQGNAIQLKQPVSSAQIVSAIPFSLCPTTMTDPLRGSRNAIEALTRFLVNPTDGFNQSKTVFSLWRGQS